MLRDKIKKYIKISGGNNGLTEEFIYNNQEFDNKNAIKVYSGATQKNNMMKSINPNVEINGKKIKVFTNEGILIARKGKAGALTYINDAQYTLNDDAYIMQVKDEYKNNISIKYLMFALKKEIDSCITSNNGGNRTFNKTLFEETVVEFPDISIQNKKVEEYEKLLNIKRKTENIIDNITSILNTIPSCSIGEMHKISEVFTLVSENRKMTEEYIYNHQGKYPVYSAQIDGAYGFIDTYDYDGEILSVVSYGDSGKTTLRKGKLTIGRNACGLLPKKEYKDKVLLQFAKYALQDVFINNAKGSDLKSLSQGTINSTEFFLPNIEEQKIIANEYGKLENLLKALQKINNKIYELID